MDRIAYDEFGLFHENAEEFGIPFRPPHVERTTVEVEPGRQLSALVWGMGPPELFLVHGGAQNAHTWDTVALALDRPLVAVDLPGHGHSDGGRSGSLSVDDNATADRGGCGRIAGALGPGGGRDVGSAACPRSRLAGRAPGLVRRLVLVDVTPGVTAEKSTAIANFVDGPATPRQLRRHPGLATGRAQSGTERVVAASGHPPQRRAAG